jgi:hypothetical protein
MLNTDVYVYVVDGCPPVAGKLQGFVCVWEQIGGLRHGIAVVLDPRWRGPLLFFCVCVSGKGERLVRSRV